MPVTIRRTTIAEVRDRCADLLREHWQEIARNKTLMVLDPDWDRYESLDADGHLLVLLAETDAGDVVGDSITFVVRHLHYAGLIVAQNDVLFVAAEHRRTGAGLRLIAETEAQAKEVGARLVMWHAKQDTDLAALMTRRGYGVQDIVFSREL